MFAVRWRTKAAVRVPPNDVTPCSQSCCLDRIVSHTAKKTQMKILYFRIKLRILQNIFFSIFHQIIASVYCFWWNTRLTLFLSVFNVPHGQRGAYIRVVHTYPNCTSPSRDSKLGSLRWQPNSANLYTTGPHISFFLIVWFLLDTCALWIMVCLFCILSCNGINEVHLGVFVYMMKR